MILDWDIPGLSGVDLLRDLRKLGLVAPVIALMFWFGTAPKTRS